MNLMKTLFHWQIAGVGCTVMVPGESSSALASRRSTAAGPTAAGPSRPALHSMISSSISLPSRQKAQVMNIPVLHFDSPVCWLNTVTVDSLFYVIITYSANQPLCIKSQEYINKSWSPNIYHSFIYFTSVQKNKSENLIKSARCPSRNFMQIFINHV